jgi:hypothetical protein
VALELPLRHLAVRDEEAQVGTELAQMLGRVLDRLDAVVQVEGLAAALVLAHEGLAHELLVVLPDVRADRQPSLRRRLDDADVPQPGERHVQRAGDRRRREREHVDLEPKLAQELLLRDAEALLLVHDHEPDVFRDDVAREDAVSAHENVHLPRGVLGEHALHLGRPAEARDHLHRHG